ncbi:MAG: glycosyltransferase [Nanoarchaeota archaeon]
MEKVSIIIPAYNEGGRIRKTLKEYAFFFSKIKKEKAVDFEILVVLNNCKDNTLEVVEEFIKKNKEILYLNLNRKGKGLAITEGFKNALTRKNDLIGFVDADMATSPEEFYRLIQKIGKYDGAIASRWKGESIIKTKQPLLRRVLSRGFNFIVRIFFLFPYTDTQCGAKIFKREVIKNVVNELNITHWAFDINLLYLCKIKKFIIKEISTVWEDKKESKINIKKAPIQMFFGIVRLRILYSPLRSLIKIYDRFPKKIKFHKND